MSLRLPEIRHDDCDQLAALCKAGGDPLRLNVLRALANDSFGVLELAHIFGVRQSGMQAFKFARLPEDVELLERARRHAREILDHDPNLRAAEHALLEDAIVRTYGPDALEPIPA